MKYTATVHKTNDAVKVIKLEAENPAEVVQKAKAMHYHVISVQPQRIFKLRSQKKFPLDIFTEQFLSLQKSGLDIAKSIETLGKRDTPEKHVYEILLSKLREGISLSDALAALPKLFPPLYVAAIKSAERTSNLTEAMERYLKYHRNIAAIQRKVVSAATYPLVLLTLGIVVLFFLLIYVIPNFSVIYEDTTADLSFAASLLINTGLFVHDHGNITAFALLVTLMVIIFSLANKNSRKKIIHTLLKFRPIKKRAQIYQLSGFYRTFSMLLNGGVPITEAFLQASELLLFTPNDTIHQCITQISQGVSPTKTLSNANLGDEIAYSLLQVGENSGNMAEMMQKIADFYDRDMEIDIDRITKLIEPVLMITIGLIIGTIIILMYIPIFDLASHIR